MWNLHILAGAMQQRNCKDLLSACLVATINGDAGFQNPGNFGLWNPEFANLRNP